MSLQEPAIAYGLEDGKVIVLPELTTTLPDGRTGYYQRDFESCLRCSLATYIQVDPSQIEVDDARIHRTMIEFAASWNLELRAVAVDEPPDHLWMASSTRIPQAGYDKHAYLMWGDELFFDPSNWRHPNGDPVPVPPLKAEFGYSLHPKGPR